MLGKENGYSLVLEFKVALRQIDVAVQPSEPLFNFSGLIPHLLG